MLSNQAGLCGPQVLKSGNLAALQAVHKNVLGVTQSAAFGVTTAGSIPNGLYTIQSVGTKAENNPQCGTYLATNPCGATGTDGGNTLQALTSAVSTYITWNITAVGKYNTYNIRGAGREACGSANNFLSCVVCNSQPSPNLVDTYTVDDGSGRQQWQVGFQDAATPVMQGIIDLHHDICFSMVVILVFVLWIRSSPLPPKRYITEFGREGMEMIRVEPMTSCVQSMRFTY